MSLARRQPTVDVVGPGSDAPPEIPVHPQGNELFDRTAFRNGAQLHLPVIVGNRDIARVAHNIDDAAIAGVEALVALEHARAGKAAQDPIGGLVHIGNKALDIEEGHGLVGIDEIADEEARPGIAGTRIGREKNVVVENGDFALEQRAAKEHVVNPRQMPEGPANQ